MLEKIFCSIVRNFYGLLLILGFSISENKLKKCFTEEEIEILKWLGYVK